MAKQIEKIYYKFLYDDRTIEGVMEIDLSRFERQFERAQYELDSMIMASMVPYMPKDTGTFINMTMGMSAALAGTGIVVAAAPPMGRYLYEGVKMVDSVTEKGPMMIPISASLSVPRFRKGAKRKATTEPLNYSRHRNPDVTAHWFDAAKRDHGDAWVKKAKKIAGGG